MFCRWVVYRNIKIEHFQSGNVYPPFSVYRVVLLKSNTVGKQMKNLEINLFDLCRPYSLQKIRQVQNQII